LLGVHMSIPRQKTACVYGGEKVGHWSGGVMPLRAE
jgi:hypothetical protein